MIERKLKYCPGKDHMAYLFSGGLCKACWQANKAKPIKKVSVKQKEILDLYRIVSRKFKEANPHCQAKLKGCKIVTTDCHHIAGKGSRELWLAESNFMALCRNCHDFCKNEPEEAMKLGLIKSRI